LKTILINLKKLAFPQPSHSCLAKVPGVIGLKTPIVNAYLPIGNDIN